VKRALLLAALALTLALAGARSSSLAAGRAPGRPLVDAKAYFVVNAATGDVLMSKNADARLPMASLTKLMTVVVALQRLALDQLVTVSKWATQAGEESAYLRAGEEISVADLVKAALIQSANDAADALADAASGGDHKLFVSWMNREAKLIGLENTHFVRPDGLDTPGHYSSARDITLLAQWAVNLPVVREDVRMRTAIISGGRRLTTWDDLLGVFRGVVGVKTGHTNKAGWCQVALLRRNGLQIYATILGSPSRSQRDHDLAAMLRYALSSYQVVPIAAAGDSLLKVETAYGQGAVPVTVSHSLELPVRVDRPLVERLIVPRTLSLPVRRGQHVGVVRIYSGAELLSTRDLVAMRSVGKAGFFGKAGWYGKQTIHELFAWA
jgi:D-alanyl-D-alanine carboxypeptidase (penicillin-binding protein 5/6)